MADAGKGDTRRPSQVPDGEVAKRWERTFGKEEVAAAYFRHAARSATRGRPDMAHRFAQKASRVLGQDEAQP